METEREDEVSRGGAGLSLTPLPELRLSHPESESDGHGGLTKLAA